MSKIKISRYIEVVVDGAEKVIFSLRTARFARLNEREYQTIFIDKNFEGVPSEIVGILLEKKILINEDENEIEELDEMRKEAIQSSNCEKTTHFVITPTMDCNARCYYCFEHGAHHMKMTPEMAHDVARYMISKSGNENISVYWYGGEPLMATDIIDIIVAELKSANKTFSSRITTNGYFLTDENLKKAKNEWNVEMIQVPLDDIGDEYNRIKNYKKPHADNPFDLIINNIGATLDAGICTRIRINFDPRDMSKITRIVDFVEKTFGDNPNLLYHFKPIGAQNIPWMSEIPWEGDDSLKTYYALSKKYQRKKAPYKFHKTCVMCGNKTCAKNLGSTWDALDNYGLLPVRSNCGGVTNKAIAIDSCGNLYVCHLMLGQDPEQYASGTIYTDFENNKMTQEYHSSELTDECKKCKLLPLCQGGCKYRIHQYPQKENRCVYYKHQLNNLLKYMLDEFKEQNISID